MSSNDPLEHHATVDMIYSVEVALLRKGTHFMGFTYLQLPSRLDAKRASEDVDVRHVSDTAIRKEYQGIGLVKMLMQTVDDELRAAGVSYVTRNASISNGYADMLERSYGHRILEKFDHQARWGRQRWLRIRL